jgi:hypothetical protein
MAKGELSYSKVRELTRVACEVTEDYLLMIARHGTAHHVEELVRKFRRAKEAEELSREAQQHASRFLCWHYDDDGSLVMKARLPAEAGAVVMKALNAAIEELPIDEGADSQSDSDTPAGVSTVKSTLRAKRADALALMSESFLQHGSEAMNGGDKYQIVIHVDKETLKHKEAGRCEFEEGAGMAAETARRCACDASVVNITENEDGEPPSVGRKTRSIPPALKRALNSRDKGCRFPGCCNKRYVDGHHIHHWANGGETKLSNLVTLCRFHHHLVHEGGVRIETLDDGAFRFAKPNGDSFDSFVSGQTSDWTQLRKHHCKQGINVDRRAAETRWRGESMDYGLAAQVLMQKKSRAGNTPAGVF